MVTVNASTKAAPIATAAPSGRGEEGANGGGVGDGVSVMFEVGNVPPIEVVLGLICGVGVDDCPDWDSDRAMVLLIGISAIVVDRTGFVKFLATHRPSISIGRDGQPSISGRQHQSLPRQLGTNLAAGMDTHSLYGRLLVALHTSCDEGRSLTMVVPFMCQKQIFPPVPQQTLCAMSVEEGVNCKREGAGIFTIPCTDSTRTGSSLNLSGLLRRYHGRHYLHLCFH